MTNHSLNRTALLLAVLLLCLGLSIFMLAPGVAATPSSTAVGASLCFPYVSKAEGGKDAVLFLTNASTGSTTADVQYLKPEGTAALPVQTYTLAAGATQVIDLAQASDLPPAAYHVRVESPGQLVGAAHVRNGQTGSVGIYQAVDCETESDTDFAVFYVGSPSGATSTLHLVNTGSAAVTVGLDLVNNDGATVYSRDNLTVAPRGSMAFASADVSGSVFGASGFGRITVRSSLPTVRGVLAKELGGVVTYANAIKGSAVAAAGSPAVVGYSAVPQFHVHSTETGVPVSSSLFILNTSNGSNIINMSFYRADGSQAATPRVVSFSAGAAHFMDAATDAGIPAGVVSVVTGSQGALAMQMDLSTDGGSTSSSGAASVSADSFLVSTFATSIVVPGLALSSEVDSVVAVQNLTGSEGNVTIELLDSDGRSVHQATALLAAGAAYALDLKKVTSLAQPFYGAAKLSSANNLVAQLDLYARLAQLPVAGVEIQGSQAPIGPGIPLTLTAVVSPTSALRPITYTWQVDDQAPRVHVSASSQDVETFVWTTPGVKQVQVIATNSGLAVAQRTVLVPAASAVTVDGAPLTLAESAGGLPVQLAVPAGAAAAGHTLTLTPLSRTQAAATFGLPETATLLGDSVLFQAFLNDQRLQGFAFQQRVTLTMRYAGASLSAAAEAQLRILTVQDGKWVDATATCSPASQYVRRPEFDELEVQICHFSPFAIATPGRQLYLPSMQAEK